MTSTDIKEIVHNEQARLVKYIEAIFNNLPAERYFEQRFDQDFICLLIRTELKKRNITTLWNDEKLHHVCLKCIIFVDIDFPKFRKNRKKTGVSCDQIAKIFNYKDGKSLINSARKYKIIPSINQYTDIILSKLSA